MRALLNELDRLLLLVVVVKFIKFDINADRYDEEYDGTGSAI